MIFGLLRLNHTMNDAITAMKAKLYFVKRESDVKERIALGLIHLAACSKRRFDLFQLKRTLAEQHQLLTSKIYHGRCPPLA